MPYVIVTQNYNFNFILPTYLLILKLTKYETHEQN